MIKLSRHNFLVLGQAILVTCALSLVPSMAQDSKNTDTSPQQSGDGGKQRLEDNHPVTKQIGADANHFKLQGQNGIWSDLPRPDETWKTESERKDRKPVWNLSPAEQNKILQTRVKTSSMIGSFYEFNNLLYASHEPFLMTTSVEVSKTQLHSPFVTDYKPTFAEFFEAMGRQTGTTIKYDPTFISKWIAVPPAMPLPYTLKLAKDWEYEDRNDYVAYHPKIQPVGMDIYMFGKYSGITPEKTREVRNACALLFSKHISPSMTIESMNEKKVDGCDAIFWQTKSPARPNSTWRQWSFVKNGQAFTIVSALDDKNEAVLLPQVQEMIDSFHVIDSAPPGPRL